MLRRLALCLTWLACPTLAHANAPYVEIQEVVTGVQARDGVQYVVLHIIQGGDLSGWSLEVNDNASPPAGTTVTHLPDVLPLFPDDTMYLLASPAAQAFFHVAADTTLTVINREGVLVLRDGLGNMQASFPYGTAVDPPYDPAHPLRNVYATTHPFNYPGGIVAGQVAQRLTYSNLGTVDNAERDFRFVLQPWPQNSLGLVGTATPGVCGNGNIEAQEQCDDGDNNGGLGDLCSAACLMLPGAGGAVCGDGDAQPSEQCDDGNLVNGDGCSSTCQWESQLSPAQKACGNGILETNEDCDPPNASADANSANTCNALCQLTGAPFCGDASVEAHEQCDNGRMQNGRVGDACDANCLWSPYHPLALCGNGVVETGEQCDAGSNNDPNGVDLSDPNVYHSGCSQACVVETIKYWRCGDALVNPGEACDHGDQNGADHDTCTATCTWRFTPASYPGTSSTTGTGGTGTPSTPTTTGGGGNAAAPTGGSGSAGSNADAPASSAAGKPLHPLSCTETGGSLYAVSVAAAAVASRSRKNVSKRTKASRLAGKS